MKRSNIIIAIQKDGRLMEDSLALLKSWSYYCNAPVDRKIINKCKDSSVEILFVRQCDIPQYVQSGVADFGIIGSNILYENDYNIDVVKELDFGRCSLIIAVPNESSINKTSDLEGERIATSYPNSMKKMLKKANVRSSIVEIAGSVEAAPMLGLADAVCDITQTGESLKVNKLRIIETIFESQAVLIESPYISKLKTSFKKKIIKEIDVKTFSLDFKKMDGLLPAIIQDEKTKEILMLGYMNEDSLNETLRLKKVVFWSRSKNRLWMKGEKSGNILELKAIFMDCDRDALLIEARLIGSGVCHTGAPTCFFTKLTKDNI